MVWYIILVITLFLINIIQGIYIYKMRFIDCEYLYMKMIQDIYYGKNLDFYKKLLYNNN